MLIVAFIVDKSETFALAITLYGVHVRVPALVTVPWHV